jgi:hypothetical protein
MSVFQNSCLCKSQNILLTERVHYILDLLWTFCPWICTLFMRCNYSNRLVCTNFHISGLLSKNERRLIKSPACLCVYLCVPPPITFESISGFSWNLVDRWRHLRWTQSHVFNLVTSAIRKWWTFKLLRWVQRNTLITFEPIGGFGWHFLWRWWHWRWPRLNIIQYRN